MNQKINVAIDSCINGLFDGNNEHLSNKNTRYIPSKDEICEILDYVKQILYPSYFMREKTVSRSQLRAMLEVLSSRLKRQIELSLLYEKSQADTIVVDDNSVLSRADEIVATFIESLPNVFEMLKLDIKATVEGDPAAASLDLVLLTYPGIEAIFVYRIAHILFKCNVPLIPRIMTEYAHSKTGIDIHPGATIGKSFVIDHGTGIVIGETTEIGNNVKLYQGVTLGAISLKNTAELIGKKRHPTVCDNVTIYAGATILGGNTIIGESATIGSSAFVTKSVESRVTVAIEKPKLRMFCDLPTDDAN